MPSSHRIYARQASLCLELAQALFKNSQVGQPADKFLTQYFRNHRELGSRDRRLIRQVVFAMFRWWGWTDHETESNWSKTLLTSFLLDENPWHPVCEQWAEQCQLPTMDNDWCLSGDLGHKKAWLGHYLQLDPEAIEVSQLFPAFFPEGLIPSKTSHEFKNDLFSCLQKRSPLWIRLQIAHSENLVEEFLKRKVIFRKHPQLPQAAELQGNFNVQEIPAYRKGAFEFQDIASQCIGWMCSPKVGEQWWDACAGAGGKTLQLASIMEGRGQVLATDIRKAPLDELRKRAKRRGWNNIQVQLWDGEKVPQHGKIFDGILVDAPCSGTGTWRRHPDARWRMTEGEIAEKAALQLQILEKVKTHVKQGGILVYATCSLLGQENEAIVEQFIEDNSDFSLSPVPHPIHQKPTTGMLTIWPHEFDSDGMFVARLQRHL